MTNDDGCCKSCDDLSDQLAAANERNRELEEKYNEEYHAANIARSDVRMYRNRVVELERMYERKSTALTAEREVSGKLLWALKLAKAYIVDDVGAGNVLDDALAEVAALRATREKAD